MVKKFYIPEKNAAVNNRRDKLTQKKQKKSLTEPQIDPRRQPEIDASRCKKMNALVDELYGNAQLKSAFLQSMMPNAGALSLDLLRNLNDDAEMTRKGIQNVIKLNPKFRDEIRQLLLTAGFSWDEFDWS